MGMNLFRYFYLLLLLIFLTEDIVVVGDTINFVTQPAATVYKTCGEDAEIIWQHSTVDPLSEIAWYLQNDTAILDEIANYNGTMFILNEGSKYTPAKESRFEYVPNAGLRIKNIQPSDEGLIGVEVDFTTLDHSIGKTNIKVSVDPNFSSPFEASPTTAVLNDTTKSLTCHVNARPAPSIKWFHDGNEIVDDGAKYIIAETTLSGSCQSTTASNVLTIGTIGVADSGDIKCSASIEKDTTVYLNATTTLVVEYSPGSVTPTFVNLTSTSINNGQSTILYCQAFSIPPPTYEIWRLGVKVASGTPADDGVFNYTIGPVEFYDDGNYSCKALNTHGNDTVIVPLAVSISPLVWHISPTPHEVDIGSTLNISCGARADPFTTTNINWTKIDGVASVFTETKVVSFTNDSITFVRDDLIIASVTKDDYGKYRCYGHNGLGSVTEDVWVWVKCSPTIVSTTLPTPSANYKEYDKARFNCTAKGYPRPTVEWKNDGVPISENITEVASNATGVWIVTSTIDLVLLRTFRGQLECSTSNGIVPDAQNTTNIFMDYRPDIDLIALNKDVYTLNGKIIFAAAVNDSIILYCTSTSYPVSDIRWYKNNVHVTNIVPQNETVNNTNLFTITKTNWISISSIEEMDNNNEYRCEATAAGLDAISGTIRVLVLNGELTKKPDDPTCVAIGTTGFLDWQYYYTQPFDDIKWEKYDDANGIVHQTLGRLEYGKEVNWLDAAKYDNHNTTLSGFYIKDVQVADEGYYGVKINFDNSAEVFINIVYLTVLVNPYNLTITPDTPIVFETNNLTLTCQTVGKPAPTLTWYKTTDMLTALTSNNVDYVITTSETPLAGNLTLSESQLTMLSTSSDDLGNYSCKAMNKLTEVFVYKDITVYYTPRKTNLTSSANPVMEGSPVVLECTTDALPHPIYYQIYHDGVLVRNSTNGTLEIPTSMYYHGGLYVCYPFNLVGYGENATLLQNVSVPPVLVNHTSPVYGIVSKNGGLFCSFYGNPEPMVYWRKLSGGSGDNLVLSESNYHTNSSVVFKQSDAAVTSVVEEDYGEYECYANNTHGFVSQNVTFLVYYAVNITLHTLVQPYDNNTEGATVIRICEATGFPAPITVRWYLNDLPITRHPSPSVKISESQHSITMRSTLTISSVDRDDQGVLECRASNLMGQDNETSVFNVIYRPVITSTPSVVEYENLNAILRLSCVAVGNEIPTIAWYKDGVLIADGGIYDISDSVQADDHQIISYLKVNPVSLDTEGSYTCNASNSLGNDSFAGRVEVMYPPVIFDFPGPVLTATEYAVDYVLRCGATGNPRPTITWYQNGTAIDNFPHPQYTSLVNDYNDTTSVHELKIKSVALGDFGNWTCEAENTIAGNVLASDENTTLLTISYDPVFVASYPQEIYYENETKTAVLSCRVKSHPAATVISWNIPNPDSRYTFETNTIETTSQYSIVERKLTISPVETDDYGNFTCVGTNDVKTINTTSLLVVHYKGTPDTTQTVNLDEGQPLTLSVPSVVSNPISTFSYYFNGTPIADHVTTEYVNSTNVTRSEQGTVLNDASVDYQNSGIYRIEACNLVGCKVDEWKVIVKYKPVLMSAIPNITHINVTDTLIVECTFIGNPPPGTIVWKHKGVTLSSPTSTINEMTLYTGEFGSSVKSTLQVTNIGASDGTDYVCSSSNSEGTTEATHNISVCHPPIIVTDLTGGTVRVAEGSSTALQFVTDSNPASTLEWKKDSSLTLSSSPSSDSVNRVDPWYTIRQTSDVMNTTVSRNMSGIYDVKTCNMLGCVSGQTTTLIVEYPPNIQPIADESVSQGDTGNFTCVVDAEPAPTIQWYFNGTGPLSSNMDHIISPTTTTTNTYNTEKTSTITVKDVQRLSDVGIYTCRATNTAGTTDEEAKLLVEYPPIENTPLQDIYIDEGANLEMLYGVRGIPAVNFTWTFNDTEVVPATAPYAIDSKIVDSTLFDIYSTSKITSTVTRNQSGTYQVVAENTVGSINDTANVIVSYAPIVSGLNNETIMSQITPSSLVCRAQSLSNPVSTITWYKDGDELVDNPGNNFDITESVELNTMFDHILVSELTFNSLSKTDSGHYKCKASNRLGEDSQTTHLIVHYPPVIVPDFPPVVYNVTEYTLDQLKCNVDSNPYSTYQWHYSTDGVTYQLVSGDVQLQQQTVANPDYEVIYNTSLVFVPNKVEKTDAGYYYCQANNYLGTTKREVQLNVFFAPDFIAPGVMTGTEDATLTSSEQFVCTMESNPVGNIIWLKDGVAIAPASYTTITKSTVGNVVTKESTLPFTNIQNADHANYTCQAENAVGASMQHKFLNVIYPPTTVTTNQTVVVTNGDQVVLNCSATGSPTPDYHWVKPDGTTEIGSPLAFTAAVGAEGLYTCVPKNSIGQGFSAQTQLFVTIQPTISSTPNCSTSAQQTKCSCYATGYPTPTIYWRKFGSDVIVANGTELVFPYTADNDGTYICYASNTGGTVDSPVPVELFGPLVSTWSALSSCNNSCGPGHAHQTRACNRQPCYETLVNETACVGDCSRQPIPILPFVDEDPLIALYVLVPVAIVATVVAALWAARTHGSPDELDTMIVPSAAVPAGAGPQQILGPQNGLANGGYIPDEESIEVNLDFDDDDLDDHFFDGLDDNDIPPSPVESFTMDDNDIPPSPVESFTMDDNDIPPSPVESFTMSLHSENLYEELEESRIFNY